MRLQLLLITLPTGPALLGFPHTMMYLFETTKIQWRFSIKVIFSPHIQCSFLNSPLQGPSPASWDFQRPLSLKTLFFFYPMEKATPATLFLLASEVSPFPHLPGSHFFCKSLSFPGLSLCFHLPKDCHSMTLSIAGKLSFTQLTLSFENWTTRKYSCVATSVNSEAEGR